MKKYISFIAFFLSVLLLFSACATSSGNANETDSDQDSGTESAQGNGGSDSTENGDTSNDPGTYKYWISEVSEGVVAIDTASSSAKFYSLQSGYYAYYGIDEAKYTLKDGILTLTMNGKDYIFLYDEENDTLTIKNSNSEADDIVYERVEGAPEPHPVYSFPNFKNLSFSPAITLSDYQLNTIKEESMEEARIKIFLNYYDSAVEPYTEITSRPVQRGDYINVDYIGYLNGSAVPGMGANTENFSVIKNAHKVDGYVRAEELIFGMIGHSVGETFEVSVPYPETHANKEIAGKTLVYEVTINSIYDTTLTMEQLQNYENFEFDSYEAYLKDASMAVAYESAIPYLVKKTDACKALPKEAYMYFYQIYLDELHALAKDWEMEYEKYLEYTGQSEEILLELATNMAADFMLAYLIFDQNDLTWTPEQYTAQFDSMVNAMVQNGVNKDRATEIVQNSKMEELHAELTYHIAGTWLVERAFAE